MEKSNDGIEQLLMSTDEEGRSLPSDKLESLAKFVENLKTVQRAISRMEEDLKKMNEIQNDLSRFKIPTLLNELSLSELRLSTGEKVIIKEKVHSSISADKLTLAYRNMINEEGGDERAQKKIDSLFKSTIVIGDLKGSHISEESLTDLLLEHDIPYDRNHKIHPQTLNKYCRERLEKGLKIPEGISVFQYQETTIKD